MLCADMLLLLGEGKPWQSKLLLEHWEDSLGEPSGKELGKTVCVCQYVHSMSTEVNWRRRIEHERWNMHVCTCVGVYVCVWLILLQLPGSLYPARNIWWPINTSWHGEQYLHTQNTHTYSILHALSFLYWLLRIINTGVITVCVVSTGRVTSTEEPQQCGTDARKNEFIGQQSRNCLITLEERSICQCA